MDIVIEDHLQNRIEHCQNLDVLLSKLSQDQLKFLSELDAPPKIETPLLFLCYAVQRNESVLIAQALQAHYEKFGNSVTHIIEYLKDQAHLEPIPGDSTNLDPRLPEFEALAFCKFEQDYEGLTSDALRIPDTLDMTGWEKFREFNSSITQNGYAAVTIEHKGIQRHFDLKTTTPESISSWLLQFLITNSNDSKATVDKWWPIAVPAIFNRMESTDMPLKARTINLIQLLVVHHPKRIEHAGLVPLMENVVEPYLSYLSPLTDVEVTKLVHRPAVLCLAQLAHGNNQRLNFVARQGCLKPFLHTRDSPDLTIYFLKTLTTVVNEHLQSLTVVHLKGLVDIFNTIMGDPFLDGSPELAAVADETMLHIIKWTWPRVEQYKFKILLGLTLASRLDSPCCAELKVTPEELEALKAAGTRRQKRMNGLE